MLREAHAIWQGGRYAGEGKVSTPSGVLAGANYAFGSLAGVAPCTTPCELLAAAIASCMSIMVAREMAKAGMRPVAVDSYAILTLTEAADKWRIASAHLKITASTIDLATSRFQQVVECARRECPIWNALKLSPTCEAKLISLVGSSLV